MATDNRRPIAFRCSSARLRYGEWKHICLVNGEAPQIYVDRSLAQMGDNLCEILVNLSSKGKFLEQFYHVHRLERNGTRNCLLLGQTGPTTPFHGKVTQIGLWNRTLSRANIRLSTK